MEETRDVEALENPILQELKETVDEFLASDFYRDFLVWRREWYRRRSSKDLT